MPLFVSLLVGLVLSSLIGLAAYRRGSLTRSGMFGATLTGTAIFGFGGLVPGILLVAFFVSSTLFSKYKARAKAEVNEKFQKGSQRDLGQALANGGWAAFLAILYGVSHLSGVSNSPVLFMACVGALATVTADTWATEIGVLSKFPPMLITTGRIVPPGTSGGITLIGTLTAYLGGLFIGGMVVIGQVLRMGLILTAFVAAIPAGLATADAGLFVVDATIFQNAFQFFGVLKILFVAGISGLAGALFDSFLGATVQAMYFAEYDEQQTERKTDSQGNPTRLVRGWRWLDNDWVNFFASVFGSLVAALLALLIL